MRRKVYVQGSRPDIQVPFAEVENIGVSCSVNADCGGPGNLCVQMGAGKRCTAACTDTAGCPSGFTCKAIAAAETIWGRACAKN